MTREDALVFARNYLKRKGMTLRNFKGKDEFVRSGNNNTYCKECRIRLDRKGHFADFYNRATLNDDEVKEWNRIVDEVVKRDNMLPPEERKNWKSFNPGNAKKNQIIKDPEITEYTEDNVKQLLDDFLGLYEEIEEIHKSFLLARK